MRLNRFLRILAAALLASLCLEVVILGGPLSGVAVGVALASGVLFCCYPIVAVAPPKQGA